MSPFYVDSMLILGNGTVVLNIAQVLNLACSNLENHTRVSMDMNMRKLAISGDSWWETHFLAQSYARYYIINFVGNFINEETLSILLRLIN